MRKKYNKLVRDGIPGIISKDKSVPFTHIASDAEYWEKLLEKLREETAELSDSGGNIDELADILEVIYAICEFKAIDMAALEKRREEKGQKRGKFKERIILEEVEEKEQTD